MPSSKKPPTAAKAPPRTTAKKATLATTVVQGKSGQDREAFLKAVSAEVRKARERADMTVSDLHRETGISRTVLQGYEAGKFVPGSLELKKLCQVLKVSPNRILFGEEKPLHDRPLLASFIGDVTKATGTAKLAIVLQVLSSEELSAMLSLVESIVLNRVGGRKKLEEMLGAVDALIGHGDTPGFIESMGEEFLNQLSPQQLAAIEAKAKESFSPKPGKK